MGRTVIANDAVDLSILQPFADRCGAIAIIQTHSLNLEAEALALAIEERQIRNAVIDIGGVTKV